MKVYIAGPIRGVPDRNLTAFAQAAQRLTAAGHTPVNPHDLDATDPVPGDPDTDRAAWVAALKRDLAVLVTCDAVAVLPGWQTSEGAQLEVATAQALDIPVGYLDQIAPRTILGLIGYAGAGKDTVADRLAVHGFAKFAFADPLRDLAEAIDPYVSESGMTYTDAQSLLGYQAMKAEYPAARAFLQRLGVGIRDLIGPDVWVGLAVDRLLTSHGPAVFTDVRFDNEAAAIKAMGGRLVRVVRPGTGPANDHVSETGHDHLPADFTLVNDADIQTLTVKVDALARSL